MVLQALSSAVDALQPWLHGLWQASWQGALWAALAWGVTRALPRLPSAVRAGLWWLVSLKFLVSLAGLAPVPLPLLPASSLESSPPPLVVQPEAPPVAPPATSPLMLDGDRPLLKGGVPMMESRQGLGELLLLMDAVFGLLLVAWGLGAAWQVRGHFKSHAAVRRLRRGARPLRHPELEAALRTLAAEAGLRRVPALYVSDAVASPLAVGLLRPRIILPERAVRRLPVEALTMALAHELAHVRRGDLWLGWVPALAEAVLFFHPLARLAVREYALAREESCDAEALRLTGAEPGDYGQLLLTFGVARAHGPAAAHGASSHLHALHRRLNMLEFVDVSRPRTLLRGALALLGLVALVPFQVVARESARPAVAATPAVLTPPALPAVLAAAPAQPAKPAPEAPPAPPAPAVKATPSTPPAPPTPPGPAAKAPPPAPPAPPGHMVSGRIHLHDDDDEDEDGDDDDDLDSYIFMSGDTTTMSGSTRDLKRVKRLNEDGKELLWVRRDGKEYVIRDPETLKQVRASFAVPQELGKQQEELGRKQAELGRQQAEIGKKQAELGQQQAEIGLKHAELAREQAELAVQHSRIAASRDEAEQERLEKELEPRQDALDKKRDELSRQMDALGDKMDPFGDEMDALGDKQEELGEQQEKLGRQMEKLVREAERKVSGLVDEAVRKGLAEPVKS